MKNFMSLFAAVLLCIVVLTASAPQPELVNPALAWRSKRVTTGSIGASGNALITITWDTPFPDTNYTPVVIMLEGTVTLGNGLQSFKLESKTASGITVRVVNNTLSSITGELQCLAIHD